MNDDKLLTFLKEIKFKIYQLYNFSYINDNVEEIYKNIASFNIFLLNMPLKILLFYWRS